jgi:tetratricopeptide (TPR) repeat protein
LGLVHEIGQGLELRGQLDKKAPALVYQVKLTAGKTYVIEMVSPNQQALDPFLVLSDAAGKKLAEDDDSGGGLNARIVFRAEQTGAFRIEARSFQNRGAGPFTLTIRESTTPSQPKANLAQARGNAARGDWKAAAAGYTQVFESQPLNDGERGFEYAAVLLLSGHQAGYRKNCAEMLERSGRPGIRPYHVARACTLAPDSVKDIALAGKKAENELKDSKREFWSMTEQGALAYRTGRYDDAATLLEQSLQADRKPGRAVLNWLWLSLVEHRRGKSAEAQAWLEKATKWLEQYPKGIPLAEDDARGLHLHNWLEAKILHREATALLMPKK